MRYAGKLALVFLLLFITITAVTFVTTRVPGLCVNWSTARRSKRRWTRLLSSREVNECLKLVRRLRESALHRVVRDGDLEIIGNASYIGGFRKKKMLHDNDILWKIFEPLYHTLAACIAEKMQCGVRYEPSLCPLPGFHIFSGDGYLAHGWHVASIHVDLQYLKVDWADLDVDMSRTLSFTLPLSLPAGAGLYFLDLRYRDKAGLFAYRKAKKERVEYKLGHLYLHDGHQFHMISPHCSGKERITLQGHAIYSRKHQQYVLYW